MKVTLGISKRAYARRVGLDHAFIVHLCREGRLPVLADGSLDPAACDRARKQNIRPRVSSRRGGARVPSTSLPVRRPSRVLDQRCQGCGGRFSEALGSELHSPDPRRFCSMFCGSEFLAGKTREQIQAQLRSEFRATGWTEAELDDSVFDYGPNDGAWNFHKWNFHK